MKGQIANLDLFIAILVFTIAIAYLLQAAELQQENGLATITTSEAQIIAENASALLVGNPDIECKLVDDDYKTRGEIAYLLNTINPEITVSKTDLGIPSEYKCRVEGIDVSGCKDIPAFYDNVYSITRQIKIPNSSLVTTKQLKNHGLGDTVNVTIKVWK